MPAEYEGREQSYIKHVVLEGYFERWLYKTAWRRRGRSVWYLDCFAGPWEAREPTLQDTSFAKALRTMNFVAGVLRDEHDHPFLPKAVFVESSKPSFKRLSDYVQQHRGLVEAEVIHGEFGAHVSAMARLMGNDPALVFVDPTGWKGADMRFIAPLASRRGRDVLINVMYEHINRFKDARHEFLRGQMRDFFGLTGSDLPPSLTEEETMALYRRQLGRLCGVPLVADLVVPLATKDRTKFRLVVGGHHPAVLELFRDVEYEACGQVAASVRTAARDRQRDERTGTMALFSTPIPPLDPGYSTMHQGGLDAIREGMPKVLARGPLKFSELWPRCLAKFHVRRRDVEAIVANMRREGAVVVDGWQPRQRKVKGDQVVRLP